MSLAGDLSSGRPLVERLPPKAPGGRPAPPDTAPLLTELSALAGLLAQVVELASGSAIFPGTGRRSPSRRGNTPACARQC